MVQQFGPLMAKRKIEKEKSPTYVISFDMCQFIPLQNSPFFSFPFLFPSFFPFFFLSEFSRAKGVTDAW